MEQQEREDDQVGQNKHAANDAKGRKQPKKLMLETKPSPMGRRVMPVVDAALRAKVEAAAAKKRKDQVSVNILLITWTFVLLSHLLLRLLLFYYLFA